ncbi:fukutin isoform X4, partial [Brachionus plicatilis]
LRRITTTGRDLPHNSQAVIKEFIDNCNDLFTNVNRAQIVNMDEIGVYLDIPSNYTYDYRGAKRVKASTSGNERSRMSLAVSSAANVELEVVRVNVELEVGAGEDLVEDLSHLELPCNVIPTVSEYSDLTIPASVYIKCEKFYYQVAVMYPRGNFYWIPKDDLKLDHVSKNFGDFNRALNRFKTVVIEYKSSFLTVPLDTDHFLYQYKHSKFIECNQQLAESTYKIQKQNAAKNTFFVSRFSYVKDIMESNKKIYWLMAGTLLEWYRECGVIPHTHDADISLYSDQFDANLEEIFLKDKLLPLSIKFGLDNDSLELRIGREGIFHMDIFFTYELNQTHQWFPYHSGREVRRTTINKFSGICSAQLLEEKFFVPCNPEKVLNDI